MSNLSDTTFLFRQKGWSYETGTTVFIYEHADTGATRLSKTQLTERISINQTKSMSPEPLLDDVKIDNDNEFISHFTLTYIYTIKFYTKLSNYQLCKLRGLCCLIAVFP